MRANKQFIIQRVSKKSTSDLTRLSWLIRVQHQLRSHFFVKLLWRQEAQSDCRLLQCSAFFMGLLRTLGDIFYETAVMSSQLWH